DEHRDYFAIGDPGNGKTWQALRERPENCHAITGVKTQRTDDDRRPDDGNQNARQPLIVLEQQDYDQRAEPDAKGYPVCLSFKNCPSKRPQAPKRPSALDREAKEPWQLAD